MSSLLLENLVAKKVEPDVSVSSNFHWGVSSSAFQTEGASFADGKGPSIWDDFTQKKGKIRGGATAEIACDFYNRFAGDLSLLKELGIKHFRFSISWPRILPNGVGAPNPKGLAFYHNLIEQCLENGITPWVTLYHWDLPLALQKQGGWANRNIVHWFEEYVKLCAVQFGDRVKHWMVLNEPMVFTGAGYFFGIHAPGIKSMNDFLAAVHHACLCQAAGGRVLRSYFSNANIGTTVSCSHISPFREIDADHEAAKKVDALLNRLFVEPFLGLGYPFADLKGLRMMEKFIQPGDMDRMAFDFDFLGVQTYTREVVRHSFFTPIVRAKVVAADKRKAETTSMNWEVYPEGMYEMLMKYASYKGIKKIIVTENGAAFQDTHHGQIVNDPLRLKYIQDHLSQLFRAREHGAPVEGYFVWTLLDNFEWSEGYHPRFGLIYVDFKTQKRTLKQSALWYSQFINELR